MQPIISSAVKGIGGIGVKGAGKGYMDKTFRSAASFKQYWDFKCNFNY